MNSPPKTRRLHLVTMASALAIHILWLMSAITVTLWLNLLVMYRLGFIGIIGPE